MIRLTLPYPPSSNRYWRNYHGRVVKSKDAREYQESVGWLARAAGVEMIAGAVALELRVFRPQHRGNQQAKQWLISSFPGNEDMLARLWAGEKSISFDRSCKRKGTIET